VQRGEVKVLAGGDLDDLVQINHGRMIYLSLFK
jgi:hypothetical protein